MKKSIKILLLLGFTVWGLYGTALSAVIYQDNFDDGNYTTADGKNGLSWKLIEGNAVVESRNGSLSLGVHRGTSTIVTEQRISSTQYTLCFDAYVTWSEPGRIIVLYKDQHNYYSIGLGSKRGIYRMMDGKEVQLHEDGGNFIRLPHASNAQGSFKIYIKNDGKSIIIKADRAGDGVDYDIEIIDTDNQTVSLFKNARIGMMTISNPYPSAWFYIDNVVIHDKMVTDLREPVVYYVDCNSGDDNRNPEEAQNINTPWETIQKAADTMFSGDTVKVMPGIYRETIVPKFSGAEGRPITYQAYAPNNRPILDGAGTFQPTSWETVSITDYKGNTHQVYKTQIEWEPNAVFQNGVRMFAAQEPNQSNPNDPYNHDEMREIPNDYNDGTSHTELVDPNFLTQSVPDYWVGGTLQLYDSYINAIAESKIVEYIPGENELVVEGFNQWTFIGPRSDGKPDRYAILHHIGVLDKPGEYYVDTSITPHEIYVWPYEGEDISTVTAAKYEHAFDIPSYQGHIVIDSFEIRYYQGNGIQFYRSSNNCVVKNCDIHENMESGIGGDMVEDILIDSCYLHRNRQNGASFGSCKNITIQNCEVTANSNNGIWMGTGGRDVFNGINLTIRNNYIHHQGGGSSHPDNFQIHQCQHVVLENNIFIQDGHQNMWTALSDDYIIRNNIFIGGVVGMNTTIRSQIYNNVFYYSSIRYDAHIRPDNAFYFPQSVIIRNNIVVESYLSMPNEELVDWEKVFTVDHNYYNIESSWLRTSWTERSVGVGEGSIVLENHAELTKCVVKVPEDFYSSFDFHLVNKSPCIDAGIPVPVYYDIEGNPRYYGMEYDIGPYEYTLLPRVVISAQPEKGYLPLKVLFSISELITPNGEIEKWEWDFGDGAASWEKEPSHTYTSPEEYTATLIVTDIQGDKGQARTHITVLEKEKEFGKLSISCYNNVFNPTKGEKALIWVELPKQARVKVNLYNTRGNKIRELADEEEEAGTAKYHWDGKDDSGNVVGSGLYFVHIQAGNHKKTKKIVVVK